MNCGWSIEGDPPSALSRFAAMHMCSISWMTTDRTMADASRLAFGTIE